MRTVATTFGIGRLDRLDRVARVDRPLERLRADDLDDVGDLHHVEERRGARQTHSWRTGVEAREDRVIARRERDDQRRQRLGEAVRVSGRLGDADLGDAGELGCGLRRRADVLAGDQNLDRLRRV